MLHVDRTALVGETRIPRDDEEPFDAREAGDEVLDHPVDKIFLLRIAAHVREWHHRDRRVTGQRQFWLRPFRRGSHPAGGFLADGAHKPDALAQDGADQALLLAVVVERGAGCVDAAAQRRLGNDTSLPNAGNQVVLADNAVAVVDQILQQVKHLGFDR